MVAFVFASVLFSSLVFGIFADKCKYSKECPGDEVCLMGECQCPEGQITYYDTCVYKNKECSEIGQILIDGQCFKKSWVHQRCMRDQQCLGGAVCQEGFCECPANSIQDGKRCIIRTHCGVGKVYVNGKCYETVGIYENCTVDEQCLGGSVCVNETCRCPRGSCYGNGNECGYCEWDEIEVKGECFASVNVDEECKMSEQCPSGAECIKGFCKCPAGTKLDSHGCFTDSETNCKDKQIFIKIRDDERCYDRVSINGKCVHTEQCLGDSICVDSVCKCPNGKEATSGRCFAKPLCKSYEVAVEGKCWDKVSIGSTCVHREQCIAKATCVRMDVDQSGICQCDSNTQYDGKECYERPMIRCPYDWISVNDTVCLPQESIGSRCLSSAQCKGWAHCIRGVCSCAPGHKELNQICRSLSQLKN
ncbi:unnamed protein product [Enterobius vermicularis]|uniref:Tenascin-X n=1 Tax=Enterobius vermicularis TaxID=51028 RepID=A0A0N4V0S0_ENTVE|nr:unnamed protein product [Enterobius vermicularis]